MNNHKVYFDNAASTMVRDEAIEAMTRVMKSSYGNPSSTHELGRLAKQELNTARESVAFTLGAQPDDIYFTSGGTEANNWAIRSAAKILMRKGKHIITSAIEHSAVLDPMKMLESEGFVVTYLSPDESGRISVESFSDALRDDTVLASVMLVNNETGIINPVDEYAAAIKQRGLSTILHTDAIQGLCKIPFTVQSLAADLITVSSHKLHGPKGVGALYLKSGLKLPPLILGGSHEKGIRGGTEPLPAAVGFGEAARLGKLEFDDVTATVCDLREYVVTLLKSGIPDIIFLKQGDGSSASLQESRRTVPLLHSPFILPISLPGHKAEVLMNFLDGEGICVSRSAACKKGARSRTLEAMGLKNDVIDGSLRISFSRYSTKNEAEYFVAMLKRASETLFKSL
ncbi:MAG: cysteine desulfurase [Oscillospiraceae bacterium]|nr:cysteine desulfurase [Oscillospiraceae bacterium]